MSSSGKIRNALKKRLEPCLAKHGFTGKYPHFRRKEGEVMHLLSVIYDKWGGGFVLEFAHHPPGPFHTPWGTVVDEEELDVTYTAPSNRARLVRTTRGGGVYADFFRYDKIAMDREQCEQLVAQVVELFPQVNAWLRNEGVGPNISPFAP